MENSKVSSVDTSFSKVDRFDTTSVLCLKGRTVALLHLATPGEPAEVASLHGREFMCSPFAVSTSAQACVVVDGRTLLVVRPTGEVSTLDIEEYLCAGCELNWEMAVDRTLSRIMVTDLSLHSAGKLKVVSIDLNRRRSESFTIDRPDSAAYALDAENDRVVSLSSDEANAQRIVVTTADGELPLTLSHRHHWVRLSPRRNQVIVSGFQSGAMAIVTLGGNLTETVLPMEGFSASWVGPSSIAFHGPGGRLWLWDMDTEHPALLADYGAWVSQIEQPIVPPKADGLGRILTWNFYVTSLPKGGCMLVFELNQKAYRIVQSPWNDADVICH